MSFTSEFILQLLLSIGTAAGVYAGIRADLSALREKAATALHSATRAHERIDKHLEASSDN